MSTQTIHTLPDATISMAMGHVLQYRKFPKISTSLVLACETAVPVDRSTEVWTNKRPPSGTRRKGVPHKGIRHPASDNASEG